MPRRANPARDVRRKSGGRYPSGGGRLPGFWAMGEISADKARIGKFGCEILEFLHGGVAETDGFDGNDRPRGEHIPHDAGPHESGAPQNRHNHLSAPRTRHAQFTNMFLHRFFEKERRLNMLPSGRFIEPLIRIRIPPALLLRLMVDRSDGGVQLQRRTERARGAEMVGLHLGCLPPRLRHPGPHRRAGELAANRGEQRLRFGNPRHADGDRRWRATVSGGRPRPIS